MIRKLIVPAVAVLLLAGCATGYTYRTAPGDYYHGQAGVIYRDYYGYPGYRSYYSPYNWGGYYGYGPGYRYRYGYPYYRWGHYRPRPGDGQHGDDRTPDRSNPPWRDIGRLQQRRGTTTGAAPGSRPGQRPQSQRPTAIQRPAPTRRPAAPASSGGSRMSELIRRARSD